MRRQTKASAPAVDATPKPPPQPLIIDGPGLIDTLAEIEVAIAARERAAASGAK
jgi:hypothetical protein